MSDSKQPSEPPPDYEKAAAEHGAPTGAPTGPPRGGLPLRRGPPGLDIPIIKYLNTKRVVLASASPRRKQLLGQMGLTNLEIVPSTLPEDLDKSAYGPFEYVAATARQKCLSVYSHLITNQLASIPEPSLVISADTVIVTRDNKVLEKPRSQADHIRMLTQLRDSRMHRVLTAITVLAPREDARHPGYALKSYTDETKVYFWGEENGLPDDVIEAYVKTREGADKAGGYAIQGLGGGVLVERIEGSWDNVVGLPVKRTLSMAEKVCFQQQDQEFEMDEEDEDEDET